MAPDKAVEIAANLYAGHPAAAPLILEATGSTSLERRERSRLALRLLDPEQPLDYLSVPEGPAWNAALAVAFLLLANVSAGSRQDRRRVAGLLAAVCRESARIHERERSAA